MFAKLSGVVVAFAFAVFLFPYAALAQGPVISSTADIAAETVAMLDVLVPYWPWILLAGIVVTAAFGLIRRGVRFLR